MSSNKQHSQQAAQQQAAQALQPQPQYPGSPMRSPTSPSLRSRQTSIAEMLSTPPPLENYNNSDVASLQLNDSSSVNTTTTPITPHLYHHNSSNNALSPTLPSSASALQRNPSLASQHSTSSSNTTATTSTTTRGDSFSNNSSSAQTQQHPHQQQQYHSHNNNHGRRDWQDIPLSELVEQNKLIFIKDDISVKNAFETLIQNNLTSVPVQSYENDLNCLTFDYTDLNSHLLLVLNKLKIDPNEIEYTPKDQIPQLISKAQRGEPIPVKFVIHLSNKNPFIKLHESDTLATVVEILGSGVHRIAITNNSIITGILSQRRLMKFLWENARRFPSMEPLFQASLNELNIGQANVISIFGDQLLIEALTTMHDLKISSVAVIDRNHNLLGNISVTDVKHVSTSSKTDLLYKSCLHFISIILNSRGLENGKDSFPIFHVTPNSSLGRTIAKLVATQAHRLWIVRPSGSSSISSDSSSSTPSTPGGMLPGTGPGSTPTTPSTPSAAPSLTSTTTTPQQQQPQQQIPNFLLEKDSARPGKLIGVISLTDILSLLAKRLGKDTDPGSARRQRRRSSSSSNRSIVSSSSLELLRKNSSASNSNPIDFR